MPKNEIAQRIFILADEQFPEQRDFAAAIGVTPSIVSQWRNDNTTSFRTRLDTIANVLGTTADYLLTGKEKAPQPKTTTGIIPDYEKLNESNKKTIDQMIAVLLAGQQDD